MIKWQIILKKWKFSERIVWNLQFLCLTLLLVHLPYSYPNSFGCEQNTFVNNFVSFQL